ncbi:Mitochondrial fusion and transport protein ugo1 [Sphaceloma murrayae]|uniref:Mitochondrial fusion and transport protein ugo1 n=1 Tax=Sphaceloma murrayae TaxID=2082308 RepID=A0A2K1R1F5_9PEZI|nr:Mitochondrial fusion and transport protein ugo1 [Sphaceloma murrayae]
MSSEYAPFQSMATSRDTPNPLRPYYVPPSIGVHTEKAANTTVPGASSSRIGIGRSAQDLLSDLDYGGPLLDRDGPSVGEMAKKIVDQAIWKYTSVLLAQPFDVAKTILQVRLAEEEDFPQDTPARDRQSLRLDENLSHSEEESDSDSPSYFTPTRPANPRYDEGSPRRKRSRGRPSPPSRSESTTPVPSSSSQNSHKLRLRQADSILETLGSLWNISGATGLWKATNATFVYNVLIKALESWTRSMLSALANLPDPGALMGTPSDVVASAVGGVNITDSPSPLASLGVAVAAAAIAGVLLAPLDLVRTRLIITPTSLPPRATLQNLRSLPSLFVSPSLLPITLLHSILPPLLTTSTPLFLRSQLHIDPVTTPTLYSLSSFLSSTAELFLKLPLETVLRRAQVSTLRTQHTASYHRAVKTSTNGSARASSTATRYGLLDPELRTIVSPGPYKGVFGTVYGIVFEEGVRRSGVSSVMSTPVRKTGKEKKGQGISGLWRGWRVGMWGLCGVWLVSAANGGNGGGEF